MLSPTAEVLGPGARPAAASISSLAPRPLTSPRATGLLEGIFAEDFEGAFPGSAWQLYGNPTWGLVTNSAHGGTCSAWCAGSALSPSSGYVDNMAAWMIYGPFSLADAMSARVRFCYRNYSEPGADNFKWLASTTGIYYYGQAVSGDQNSWSTNSFDLSSVNVLGNLCGQSQVWIAFLFKSNGANSGPTYTGAFVDDIVLERTVLNPLPQIRIEPLTLTLSNAPPVARTNLQTSSLAVTSAVSTEPRLIRPEEILKPLQAGATRTKVIVNLRTSPGGFKPQDAKTPSARATLHRTVRQAQDAVLSVLAPGDFQVRHRFENQAGFSVEVSAAALATLALHPNVESIEPVLLLDAHLAQGLPLINGLAYRSAYNGAGVAIAICDTGIDYTHPRLGGGAFPNAKVLGGYDFGDNDADPMPQGQAHGTCCAGIAAGDLGTVGDYIGGVACGAKLYALKLTPQDTSTATTDAMVAAWDWCISHQNDHPEAPILVISTSFGGGRAFEFCDGMVPSMAQGASNAVTAGITVLASAGNDGFCDSLAWPACNSAVLAVGAVYDAAFGSYGFCLDAASCCASKIATTGCATGFYGVDSSAPDQVPSYSNFAPFLGLLAPANAVYTTDIVGAGGYDPGDYYAAFGGTSAASPYAAGAVACLQSAAKANLGRYLTAAEVKAALLSTGDAVFDPKAGLTKPRLNLGHALQSIQPGFTIYNDGGSNLLVTALVPDAAAPWLSWSPSTPFTLAPGTAQGISVRIDFGSAPTGPSTLHLGVYSNDPLENPYPGGINLLLENGESLQPRITGISLADGTNVVVNFSAPPNRVYMLEEKSDPAASAWSVVLTNLTSTNGITQAVYSRSPTAPRRFYRIGLR
jgi:subtilisin family serine protease